MGCLLKTLEKGFVRLDKDQPKEKANQNNKSNKSTSKKNNNKINIKKESDNKINEKNFDIKDKSNNNKNNNALIKNKDNYFKSEQIDYYINIYLKNHISEEPIEKLNFKK